MSLISLSFIICYSPYLINFIYPLVDLENNSYELIQNSNANFKTDFNIFTWFVKTQFYKIDYLLNIFSNKFYFNKQILVLFLTVLFTITLIFFNKLFKKRTKFAEYILNKNIVILTLLTIIFLIVAILSQIILVLPIILLMHFYFNKFNQKINFRLFLI